MDEKVIRDKMKKLQAERQQSAVAFNSQLAFMDGKIETYREMLGEEVAQGEGGTDASHDGTGQADGSQQEPAEEVR